MEGAPEEFLDRHGTKREYRSNGHRGSTRTINGEAKKRRFELVPFDRIELRRDRAHLVKGIIPREGLVVVWGPPKCGKTFWTFDIAMHIALGWEYRGRRTSQGAVVYIACEGERGLTARKAAFQQAKMTDRQGAVPFFLLASTLDLVKEAGTLGDDIEAQLGGAACALVVIDTLNRSLVGSESSDEDMAAYVKATDALRERFHCAVIIIHHCGHDTQRPRGHTSLMGAADAQIAATHKGDATVLTAVEFMKDGESGAETFSRLKVVEVGRDEDGEPITSCVIEPVDDTAIAKRLAAKAKVRGPAFVTLELLKKAVAEAGEPPPASDHIPRNARGVSVEVWRRFAYAGSVSESDKPEAKRKAFARAINKLQEAKAVAVWNDYAWLLERPE